MTWDVDRDEAYRIEEAEGTFRLVDREGRAVLECGDRNTARHYVDLLNKAFRVGYKAGYRAARRS